MLNEKSPVPLYYQLQEVIRGRIESGDWQAGQQVPPESDLCQEFNLSRGTVRQALSDLVREGLLTRRRGKGSFVAVPKISQDIMGIAGSFISYANKITGKQFSSRIISVETIKAKRSLAEKLDVAEGTEVVKTRKVNLIDGEPYFLAMTYVRKEDFPGLESHDLGGGSIFDLLREHYGIHVTRVEGWFEPTLINEYDAALLNVEKGSPAMGYERIRYTTDDKPLMFTRHIIRGDMCRLTFAFDETETKMMERQ